MRVRADGSDARRLSVELGAAAAEIIPASRAVVQKGALNIKQGAQRRVSGHPHWSGYPGTITYDTKLSAVSAEAEIGPDKSRGGQAPFGAILEYGSVNSPPIPHLGPSLDEEAPRFEQALAALAEKILP